MMEPLNEGSQEDWLSELIELDISRQEVTLGEMDLGIRDRLLGMDSWAGGKGPGE